VSELPPCPACGGAFGVPGPYPGAAAHASALRFEAIVECGTCGLGMALPAYAQKELDAFYSAGEYWNEAVGRSQAQVLHERNQCRHRVERVIPALPATTTLRVLDVGAGHGWTSYWLERSFPGRVRDFDFIEPDDGCSREILARDTAFGKRRLASLDAAQPGYDLVFLNHVLEHVADPVACLAQVSRLLAPQGLAYFETPHADQRFKADVFPHTWFFTPAALEHLGRRTGMNGELREAFGRMPSGGGFDLAWRAAFRASAAGGWADLAGLFDDRVWRYAPAPQGIWLRWIVSRAGRRFRPASPAE